MECGKANSVYITKNIMFFCLVSSVASMNYNLDIINSNLKEFSGFEDMFKRMKFNLFFNKKRKDSVNSVNDLKHSDFGKKNKVLVKRIIPHGYKTGSYEYDSKFDVFYRPLVKVHRHPKRFDEAEHCNVKENSKSDESNVKSDESNVKSDESNVKSEESNVKSEESNVKSEESNLNKDMLLLQPFLKAIQKKRPKQRPSLKNIVRQMLNTLKTLLESKNVKSIVKLPKLLRNMSQIDKESVLHLIRILASLFTDEATLHEAVETILRLSNRGRTGPKSSGEIADPVLHDNHLHWPNEEDEEKKKTEAAMPEYSLWDYWTYAKPLYADECPEHQVKVNNMCIWTPPH